MALAIPGTLRKRQRSDELEMNPHHSRTKEDDGGKAADREEPALPPFPGESPSRHEAQLTLAGVSKGTAGT